MVEEDYTAHLERVTSRIVSTVQEEAMQPILFLGSGITKRYIDGPSWVELLEKLSEECPITEREVSYYTQKGLSEEEVSSQLAEDYYEWAYGSGRDQFPDQLYDEQEYDEDIFIKYAIAEYFRDTVPNSLEEIDEEHEEEIRLLREINPHAIITTNYDQLLELIFPDYEPIIGEQVIKSPQQNVGEIFKIHGCVSNPDSLVLTENDYDRWNDRKKYISAKLLTFFTEHPILIAGYGVGDRNIKSILNDIDEILATEEGRVENLFFLNYHDQDDLAGKDVFESQRRFETLDGDSILLNHIVANGFERVYKSFSEGGNIKGVNLKLLRSVMANTYDVIAKEAPREEVEINYTTLKNAAESEDAVGTMFGVTLLDNPPDLNIYYRYRTTDVADELGLSHFNYVVQILEQIEEETGIDIRESNNQYHIDIAFNSEDPQHRYSDSAVELLRRVQNHEEYELNLNETEFELDTGEPMLSEA
jgi:hypothetical protein